MIFAWAAIFHSDHAGRRESNPFAAYQRRFIALNCAVSGALFALAVGMALTAAPRTQSLLYQCGTALIAAVDIVFAIFFLVYGLLLVRSLTKDFASPYARKLFTVAVLLAVAFAASSAIQLLSVIDEQLFAPYLNELNAAYFSLDLFALFIILGLFAKSVTESSQSASKGARGGRSVMSTTVQTADAKSRRNVVASRKSLVQGTPTTHRADEAENALTSPIITPAQSPRPQMAQPRLSVQMSAAVMPITSAM